MLLVLVRFREVDQDHEEGDQLKSHVDHRRHIAFGRGGKCFWNRMATSSPA